MYGYQRQANYDGNYDYQGCGPTQRSLRAQTVSTGSLPAMRSGSTRWPATPGSGSRTVGMTAMMRPRTMGQPVRVGVCSACGSRGGWGSKPENVRSACRFRNKTQMLKHQRGVPSRQGSLTLCSLFFPLKDRKTNRTSGRYGGNDSSEEGHEQGDGGQGGGWTGEGVTAHTRVRTEIPSKNVPGSNAQTGSGGRLSPTRGTAVTTECVGRIRSSVRV